MQGAFSRLEPDPEDVAGPEPELVPVRPVHMLDVQQIGVRPLHAVTDEGPAIAEGQVCMYADAFSLIASRDTHHKMRITDYT